METPEWFVEWAGRYATAFGIQNPEWLRAMTEHWYPAFAQANYLRSEIEGCIPFALTDPTTPRFLGDHLACVKRAVAAVRDAARGKTLAADDLATGAILCGFCGWSTWVVVPHPADVKDGAWRPHRLNSHGDPVYRTASVACTHCGPGRRAYDATARRMLEAGKKEPMTIGQYEMRVNAAWREHLVEQAAARRAMWAAETESSVVGGVGGAVAGLVGRAAAVAKNPPSPAG